MAGSSFIKDLFVHAFGSSYTIFLRLQSTLESDSRTAALESNTSNISQAFLSCTQIICKTTKPK
jgi:hypothetical protein